MDDRQRTIVEGAGLEESRLNQDFIEFLRKWGTPILLVVVLLAALYSGSTMWARHKERTHNQAYADLHAAAVAGSPDNLVVVAEQHKGKGAVYSLALIEAADAFLEAARVRVRPGGDSANPEDQLSDEQVASMLDQAGDLYGRVVDATNGKSGRQLQLLNGLFGLAAVAESQDRLDAARENLNRAREIAEGTGFVELARIADERLATLDQVADIPTLYAASDVRSSGQQAPARPSPINSDLGGSLSPMLPGANDSSAAPPDPFEFGSGPLPSPPPDVAPEQTDDDAPTP
ncbi:MAG: hypothetical protein ACTS27_01325 [Phycisphaerales bacterium]